MIAAIAILLCYTFSTESLGTFLGWSSYESPFDGQVAEEDTMGSESWYERLDEIQRHVAGNIYADGTLAYVDEPVNSFSPYEPYSTYWGVDFGDWGIGYQAYSWSARYWPPQAALDHGYPEIISPNSPYGVVAPFGPFGQPGFSWDVRWWDTNDVTHVSRMEFVPTKDDNLSYEDYMHYMKEVYGYSAQQVYLPKARRLTKTSRSAILATYDAYFERLYYTSEGPSSEWGPDEGWGSPSPDWYFVFWPTNSFTDAHGFRPSYPDSAYENGAPDPGITSDIAPSLRLLESGNIASLLDNLERMFPPDLRVHPVSDPMDIPPSEVRNSTLFLFRPWWITDARGFVMSDEDPYGSHLFWASSATPPLVEQNDPYLGPYVPSVDEINLLFPKFVWDPDMEDPPHFVQYRWPLYSITFAMADPDPEAFDANGAGADNPCDELFRAVEMSAKRSSSIESSLRSAPNYRYGTVLEYVTNAFPRAAKTIPDAAKSFGRYRSRVAKESPGAITPDIRLDSTRTEITGQVLALMDTTLHIPSMALASTNTRYHIEQVAEYSATGGEEIRIRFEWDESGHLVPDESTVPDEFTFAMSKGWTDTRYSVSTAGHRGLHAEATTPTLAAWPEVTVAAEGTAGQGTVNLTEDWYFPDPETGVATTNWILRFNVYVLGDYLRAEAVGMDGHTVIGAGLGDEITHGTDDVWVVLGPPSDMEVKRAYEYEDPTDPGTYCVSLGPTQPGNYGEMNLLFEGEAVALARMDTWGAYGVTNFAWASELSDSCSGRSAIGSFADECASGFAGGLLSKMLDSLTYDPRVPDVYAPLPDDTQFVAVPETGDGEFSVGEKEYPVKDYVYTNEYHFVFDVPVNEYVIGDIYFSVETNVDVLSYFSVEETYVQFPDGHVDPFLPPVTNFLLMTVTGRGGGEPFAVSNDLRVVCETSRVEWVTYDPSERLGIDTFIETNVVGFTLYDATADVWRVLTPHKVTYDSQDGHIVDDRSGPDVFVRDGLSPWHIEPVSTNIASTAYEYRYYDPSMAVTNWVIKESAEIEKYIAVIHDADGNLVEFRWVWWNPFTGEEETGDRVYWFEVGSYKFACGALYKTRQREVPLQGGETGFFGGDVFFRLMTRVKWFWNALNLLERVNK